MVVSHALYLFSCFTTKASMRIRTLVVGFFLITGVGFRIFLWVSVRTFAPLRVTFLDIGQGDAILISEGDTQVLIDSGSDGRLLLSQLGRTLPFWDRQIEVMIATHPDADHIGGFASVLRRYRVRQFYSNGASSDTGVFQDLWRTLEQRSETERSVLGTGSRIVFPGGAELEVLFPVAGTAETLRETNEGSIVTRLVYGQASFLLTGDLPHEETVLPEIAPTRVLKAAHHGSKYSTSQAWLEKVKPEMVVISVGKNRYGHPAPEVLERLRTLGISHLRTDRVGNISYVCQSGDCHVEH